MTVARESRELRELIHQDRVNRRADELLVPRGMKIETMNAEAYRTVMEQLRHEGLIK